MDINSIVPGRIYSWVYEGEQKQNKGGRAGVAPNPLFGRVTKRSVYAGQAIAATTYVKKALELNPAWTPSDREPIHEITPNPCVVRNVDNGQCLVRILNPRTVKCEYFVDGRPATPEEIAIIKQYKPARKDNPLAVKIMFPYVDNLSNVEGEIEAFEDCD